MVNTFFFKYNLLQLKFAVSLYFAGSNLPARQACFRINIELSC